ncbi:uncharacterized protein MONOS_1516 [Monocercomonoides exilis]|uniref:uncharacterized protein n=1 Tax=Monocercomonoides exilis TaxID=2049356 RepID=UPI00355A9925|nr:hypothetical protein MONOS_1516 [Monocercomonoides exilis]|eukprot:MONOS_1516.1-p1 / transcript=MONOS_1516.1 / gene=MONOS_1516 / organism=Monocercomonoides_exilis_PA203 / gene_product=unspecified product / transcript_product=unspecified product / location=Mono_scaffold00027:32998-33854(-) / protein_length=162 / sequence_SO=supercontig / SO=protein_coding / is_pseudo=false
MASIMGAYSKTAEAIGMSAYDRRLNPKRKASKEILLEGQLLETVCFLQSEIKRADFSQSEKGKAEFERQTVYFALKSSLCSYAISDRVDNFYDHERVLMSPYDEMAAIQRAVSNEPCLTDTEPSVISSEPRKRIILSCRFEKRSDETTVSKLIAEFSNLQD